MAPGIIGSIVPQLLSAAVVGALSPVAATGTGGSTMSTLDAGMQAREPRDGTADRAYEEVHGLGWLLFAGIMLLVAGVLNVICGIAAIDDSSFFVADSKYIISSLNTWGWVTPILGGLQVVAAFSIWAGNQFGRWFGITAASLSAIGALLAMPAYPFWSLAIFAVDILIVYGLAAYGRSRRSMI